MDGEKSKEDSQGALNDEPLPLTPDEKFMDGEKSREDSRGALDDESMSELPIVVHTTDFEEWEQDKKKYLPEEPIVTCCAPIEEKKVAGVHCLPPKKPTQFK
ncbi:uncharacterized protein LOC144442595 [Glandiceps talaboti]